MPISHAMNAAVGPTGGRDRSGDRSRYETGDPIIDRTTEDLLDIATNVANSVQGLKGATFGIAVHYGFAQAVRKLNLPGIGRDGLEQSFSLGETVRYGLEGSVRTDVVQRDGYTAYAPIRAVWDVKTGNAKLSGARVDEIRSQLNIDDSVPIIQIHVDRGVTIKATGYQSILPQSAYARVSHVS